MIKKSVIIEEWKRRCYQRERKRRIEEKSVFKVSNAKNRLLQSLQKLVKKDHKVVEVKRTIGFVNKEAVKKQMEVAQKLKEGFMNKIAKPAEEDAKVDQIEGIDMSDYKVPEVELRLVDDFLS